MQTTYSVQELNAHIRWMFERDDALQDLWVEGEVSGFKRAQPSGHCYFALKDGKAQIDCAMWRSSAQQQAVLPKDGDAVLAHGYVSIYEERSKYQFYVDRIRPIGIGDLFYQFELLKAKLDAEGLFDPARKRPLPPFPRRIGVVTSPNAAAFQDVQNVLRRRFPLVEVLLSPTLVQGIDAPAQIIRALERLNAHDDLDAILVCRGGGSLEDLWAFNDEGVAHAIAASRVPVVSGVGHETDFTIADFAADVRAPTPSAAAELLTPDFEELRYGLERASRDLDSVFAYCIGRQRDSLAEQARALRQLSPLAQVRAHRQRIDDWGAHIASAHRGRLALLRERVVAREGALRAANPQAILERGYALVTDAESGARITSVNYAVGRITVRFHDGAVEAKVEHD
ncbi:MAG: exodeoxyribonuclease VII large subunit [Anaerolineae bacterium]|nr:exodeoxyribonuclease VII large subunit [Anaerolineae bacterium]